MMDNLNEQPDLPAAPAPEPVRYVTFTEDGALDGCYLQVPAEEHVGCMIVIAEELAGAWVNYRATDDRKGIELAPAPVTSPTPVLVPQQVTMRQARLALLAAGRLGQIDAAIDSLSSPTKEQARIEWDYSSTVVRDRDLVKMIGAALGMDDADLDQMFITAAGL